MALPAFTNSSGFGPLPRLLDEAGGKRMVKRVFQSESLPIGAAFEPNCWIPLRAMTNIFEQAARAIGDPLFGLHVGQAMRPEDFGLFAQYAISARDLRTMIERVNHYIIYHQSGTTFGLQVQGDVARWHYRIVDRGASHHRHHADHILWPLLTALRSFLGHQWVPLGIDCSYDRPACWRQIEVEYGAPVAYGQKTSAIKFQTHLLETQASRPILIEGQITCGDLRRMVSHRPPATILESVRHVVRTRLTEAFTDLEGTADLLDMSARSLQRFLGEENLTFRDVLEQVRVERALGTAARYRLANYEDLLCARLYRPNKLHTSL